MKDITKVKIWKILASSNHFWVTTLILYLQQRGLSLSESLTIISVYSVLCVILEYPTGVIGDYFSHKTSVLIGNILIASMFFLVTLDGNFYYYLFVGGVLSALSFTLMSGSDTALLHSISKDFKKDVAQITPISLILSAINITAGGLLASIDNRFPYYASFVYAGIAIPFMLGVKAPSYARDEGNIWEIAKNGIRDVFSSKSLRDLTVVSSVFGAFFISIKWFYNPLFEKMNIAVEYWGMIASVAFLLIAIGALIYRKNAHISLLTTSIVALIFIFLIGFTNYWIIPIIGVWLTHVVRGYQETHLGVIINNQITTNRRASILSFNSLLTRVVSSIYIIGVGYLLPRTSFFIVLTVTVVVIGFIIASPMKRIASSVKTQI